MCREMCGYGQMVASPLVSAIRSVSVGRAAKSTMKVRFFTVCELRREISSIRAIYTRPGLS